MQSMFCPSISRCMSVMIRAKVNDTFTLINISWHDDVIIWKRFPRYWPFVRGIHREPMNSLHKGQWRGALMFSLICVWINGWVNSRGGGDLRRYRAHYDVIVIPCRKISCVFVSLCNIYGLITCHCHVIAHALSLSFYMRGDNFASTECMYIGT